MCEVYPIMCNSYLDKIACTNARTVVGCSSVNNTLPHYIGQCICNSNPIFSDKSSRIRVQLIDNRIKPEVTWMIEPWASGPPYSLSTSCKFILILYLFLN